MTLEGALDHFREAQAELFRSTATIKYFTGDTFNPTTGDNTPIYTTRATGVACLIRPRSGAEAQSGQEEVVVGRHEGKFPLDTVIEVDDLVTITGSQHDPAMVGKVFAVKERLHDDWQISRRVVLEVVE